MAYFLAYHWTHFRRCFRFFQPKVLELWCTSPAVPESTKSYAPFPFGEIKHCDALTTRCIHNAKSHYNTKYLNQNGKYAFISVINRAFRFQLRTTCRSWIAQGIIIPKVLEVELLLIEWEKNFLRNTSSKENFSSCVCTLHTRKRELFVNSY